MTKLKITMQPNTISYAYLASGLRVNGIIVDNLTQTEAIYSGLTDWNEVIGLIQTNFPTATTEILS